MSLDHSFLLFQYNSVANGFNTHTPYISIHVTKIYPYITNIYIYNYMYVCIYNHSRTYIIINEAPNVINGKMLKRGLLAIWSLVLLGTYESAESLL